MTEAPTAAQLLADLAWLRRLAFALAGDADDADDLVQESWIAAWQRHPATDRPLRPWLGKVVRDVAAMKRRGDSRRRAREHAVHDDSHAASPDALLETMRLHRTLVDCVLELEEPFRATIIASFVEGRSSAAIARSLGVPDSTIRWRLREGLLRLRTQLDSKVGDRKRWAPMVLALRKGAAVTTSSKLAAVVVTIIVLLLLGGTGVYVAATRSSEDGAAAGSNAASGPTRVVAGGAQDGSDATTARPWWDARGLALHPIAGHVITPDGSPIAGATVALYGWSAVVASEPEAKLVTDATGAFRFDAPRNATVYRIVATAAGHAGHTVSADPRGTRRDDSERVVIVLPACTSKVEGVVTDSGAGPISGASVTAETRSLAVGPTAITSRDGHYELCLSPEIELLEVGADGYEHVTAPVTPHDRQHVDVALAPGTDLVGRVVDADSGAGVANAQVFVGGRMLYGHGPGRRQTLSEADGAFTLTGLGAGELFLNVWSGDHVLVEPMQIAAIAGRHLGPVVVTVRAAAQVQGLVRSDGRPLSGALVSFDMPSARGPVPSLHVATGADGRFVALGVVPSAGVVVHVDGSTVLAPTTIDTRHPSDLVIDVAPRPTIRGHVMHHGKPVIDAIVTLTKAPAGPGTNTTSDSSGAFELVAPAAGSYGVYADSKVMHAFASRDVPATAPSDRDVIVDLNSSASISGVVVDDEGKPQTGLIVRGVRTTGDDRGGAVTAIDGAFTLDELAGGGDYEVTVVPDPDGQPLPWAQGTQGRISVASAETHLTGVRLVIASRRGSTIRGTVVDDSNSPVADAFVRLSASAEGTVRTDDSGRFSLPVFGDGPFWIVAATDWRRPAGSISGVAFGATDVTIKIARTGSVRGTLVGFGQPSVTMRAIGDAYPLIAHVDGTIFSIDDLVAGDYIVGATSANGRSAAAMTHIAPGATATVTLTAASVHHVDARVTLFDTGAPVGGIVAGWAN